MNGGQVATRGFLLQTLIALLDILADVGKVDFLQLEPTTNDDKTDFVIGYVGGLRKAVQVKSSINQIGLPDVKKWAGTLKADLPADSYELILIGPVSGDLAKTTEVDGVAIPSPKSLDVEGLLGQAAHRIDLHLHKNNQPTGSPLFREFMVDGLIGKLSVYSTSGIPLSRTELEETFQKWIEFAEQIASDQLKSKYGNGTLTDGDALKEYAACFDRPALQDSMRQCWSYSRFASSLGELIELVNTGCLNGKFVTKRRMDFGNQEWRQGLEDVYHELRNLRQVYSEFVRSQMIDESTCGCKCSQSIVLDFEGRKRRILHLLNQLLVEAGIPEIRIGS